MENKPKYPDILTKENFWNDIQEKHPKQMKVFCDWIDEYKKRTNWDFWMKKCITVDLENDNNKQLRIPKFHEIPIAMQIGIIMEFSMSHEDAGDTLKMDVVNSIEGLIKGIKV